MAVLFLEPGGDADFGTGLWNSVLSTPTIVTDFVHGGHVKSIRYRPSNGDAVRTLSAQDSGTRFSLFVYFVALPGATASFIAINQSGDVTSVFKIKISSGGVISITDDNDAQLGSNGTTLSTGQWYRISCAYTIASSTVNSFRFWVNGAISNTFDNLTLAHTTSALIKIGNMGADATRDFRSSDHYFDNSSSLTDPGNIWVTAKRPNANGTANGFVTQIGVGGSSYGSGHSPQVNERPQSDTNGWSIITTTVKTEEYNIENVATGDINITGATIVDYMGWVRTAISSTLNSPSNHIILNGVSTAITLTALAAYYTAVAGSTSYPAGTGVDIGMDGSWSATGGTISFYECGVVVAYIPASTSISFVANPWVMVTR